MHIAYVKAAVLPVMPYPQQCSIGQEPVSFPTQLKWQSAGPDQQMQARLAAHWQQFATSGKAKGQPALVTLILLDKDNRLAKEYAGSSLDSIGQEGYVLVVNTKDRFIAANTETGLFYGLQTLKQLTRGGWHTDVSIVDWPAYSRRVIFDDISRGPISTVPYIKKQIARMAELKINYLSFYIEHVVQPLSHPDFAPANGKLTIAQIKELSAYAANYHMQLIGSFQSFGHFEKILSLPQYHAMGESSSLISPRDPKARKFLADVIGELCGAFSAPWFNVNCDETFGLGKGRSKAYVDSVGVAKFYADHLKFLYDVIKQHGKQMMMWGDIALQHEDVLDMLPKDVIYLTWEYGDQPNFDAWTKPFAKRGLQFMVCAGILNSYRMFPDMAMAKANINGFFRQGKQDGATGAFTTIWDDGGAYLFDADWYGVYMTADRSWNLDTAQNASFDQRYETTAYQTSNGQYVKALFKLMELRALPLTYNLNDQLWQQEILPANGKKLILNNTSATAALALVEQAESDIAAAAPRSHAADIAALQFAISQYKLMITTRLLLAGMVTEYTTATALMPANPQQASVKILACADTLQALTKRYQAAAACFKKAWLQENQPYWLNVVLEPYEKKSAALAQLEGQLRQAAAQHKLPDITTTHLNIMVTDRSYFRNWMLCGPLPVKQYGDVPDFLYTPDKTDKKTPSPGDFIRYAGKIYNWQKFPSMNGGIIDLDEKYHYKGGAAITYAYCQIKTDSAATVTAYLDAGVRTLVYCNGVACGEIPGGGEQRLSLPLKAGVNHILLKMGNAQQQPWYFTFRLEDDIAITNHKHKYQLNAKSTRYEVD
ncbi:glycoside hydrolase family 20 zincin-like fold domain-containing protein [Chitinophaga agrisoli]|uniref:glycoside hydrolase family 20 zincin-like fold domain-containing protein n=1 Tax=Chitinophaga agrisoli TaxID=2607653 RepID=UPI001BCA2738|nr:glycoside hydrolase family 20 zincin-like fold domain-containing protein [Chitinophaga agrisoli]